MKTIRMFVIVLALVSFSLNDGIFSQWQSVNFTNFVNDPITDITKCGPYLFCAAYGSGVTGNYVWRSSNNGQSWEFPYIHYSVSLPRTVRNLISVDTVLLASVNYSPSLYRSTNYGNTWQPCAGVGSNQVTYLSNSNNVIYASSQDGGLYRSTDIGVSWVKCSSPVAFKLNSVLALGNDVYVSNYPNGVMYKSTDLGNNWTTVNNGLPTGYYYKLGKHLNSIFASTGNSIIYKSTNDGANWSISNSGISGSDLYSITSDSVNVYALFISGGVYKSTDNGSTWYSANNGFFSGSAYTVQKFNNTLFAGGLGMFSSTSGGSSWQFSGIGITNSVIKSTHIEGNTLHIGTMTYYFRTTNEGNTFYKSPLVGYYTSYMINSAILGRQGHLLFGDRAVGYLKSIDNGASWSIIGYINNYVQPDTRAMMLDSIYTFAATDSGVYRSTNFGSNWEGNFSSGLTNRSARCIAKCNFTLFTGTDGGMFRSTNRGVNWVNSNNGLTSAKINYITQKQSDIYAATDSGVYRSTNNGDLWSAVNSGLTNLRVRVVKAKSDTLFAGTQAGLFVTTNNGASWSSFNGDLPFTDINTIDFINNTMFVGTNGMGLYKRSMSLVGNISVNGTETPGKFDLKQNYPNPFNPSTKINFSIPASYEGETRLNVYDISGRLVKTLVQQDLKPGNYEVSFDASGYSSGVYFYTLKSGIYNQTKKMLLIK
ncbi:MAG: T9SS type A sorting domain-containing protein [Ignavibacteria bacterium]|nr:T9SS type A sorting domain-containing protein [Ignavibacteria bacterium]